ncbi:hypothetical protein LZ32DRAFT_91844 [Colletotrichum eremochloae]|nr:hypothetical protein LZ32DRAFT_91844 [Colletotrichum eremochloae]
MGSVSRVPTSNRRRSIPSVGLRKHPRQRATINWFRRVTFRYLLLQLVLQTSHSFSMYSLRRRTVCPEGSAFYTCSNNSFRGCCSTDPCALPDCPGSDALTEHPYSITSYSTSTFTTSSSISLISSPYITTDINTKTLNVVLPTATGVALENGNHETPSDLVIGLAVGLGVPLLVGIGLLAFRIGRPIKKQPGELEFRRRELF